MTGLSNQSQRTAIKKPTKNIFNQSLSSLSNSSPLPTFSPTFNQGIQNIQTIDKENQSPFHTKDSHYKEQISVTDCSYTTASQIKSQTLAARKEAQRVANPEEIHQLVTDAEFEKFLTLASGIQTFVGRLTHKTDYPSWRAKLILVLMTFFSNQLYLNDFKQETEVDGRLFMIVESILVKSCDGKLWRAVTHQQPVTAQALLNALDSQFGSPEEQIRRLVNELQNMDVYLTDLRCLEVITKKVIAISEFSASVETFSDYAVFKQLSESKSKWLSEIFLSAIGAGYSFDTFASLFRRKKEALHSKRDKEKMSDYIA